MKKKSVKMLCMCCAVGLAVSLAGCGQDAPESGQDKTVESGQDKTAESGQDKTAESGGEDAGTSDQGGQQEEAMTLQVYVNEDVAWNENAVVLKKIEEDFNVKFEPIQRPAMNQADWYALKFASSEAEEYDYITSGGLGFSQFDQYVEEDVLTPIPMEMVEKNMPNLMEWSRKYQDAWDGNIFDYFVRDGELYSIPQARPDDAKRNVLGFRQDWLDKLNLEVPATVEEMETVLRAFVEQDPDGNGENDTYGYTGTNWLSFSLSPFFGAFGVYPDCWYEKDGELILGKTDAEGMKAALTVIARWYKEGLIDPEILVQGDFAVVKNKVCSSQAGATTMYYGDLMFADNGWFYSDLLAINPQAKWTVVPGLEGNGVLQFNPLAFAGVMFTEHMADESEKMEKYMQVFDALMAPEYQRMLNWGIEGETYTVNENGDCEWLAPYDQQTDESVLTQLGEQYGIGSYGCASTAFSFISEFWSDPDQRGIAVYTKEKAAVNTEGLNTAKGTYDIMSPYTSRNESNGLYSEAVGTLYSAYISDIISGERSVDSYDDFLKEFYEQGGDKIIEEERQLYQDLLKGN